MAIEADSNEVVPTFDDSYYEERASVEEIYLEETGEALRAVINLCYERNDRCTSKR